jgi:hypothetical protein
VSRKSTISRIRISWNSIRSIVRVEAVPSHLPFRLCDPDVNSITSQFGSNPCPFSQCFLILFFVRELNESELLADSSDRINGDHSVINRFVEIFERLIELFRLYICI